MDALQKGQGVENWNIGIRAYVFIYVFWFIFIQFRGQDISWNQLLGLYEWDVGLERTSPGLRRLHKLTHEHLHLTPSLRMRVYMAVQVLKGFYLIFSSWDYFHLPERGEKVIFHFPKSMTPGNPSSVRLSAVQWVEFLCFGFFLMK